MFKPQLIPNFKKGEPIDWHALIPDPENWLVSVKLDGGRLEIFDDGTVYSRALKPINNVHIKRMAEQLRDTVKFKGILEAEFYSPDMSFSEIMHFMKSEDVTSDSTKKKYEALWKKTDEGKTVFVGSKAYLVSDVPKLVASGIPRTAIKMWPFPGRNFEWATSWHNDLTFRVFDYVKNPENSGTKIDRYKMTEDLMLQTSKVALPVYNGVVQSVDQMLNIYKEIIDRNGEGLVVARKSSPYKFGRHTLKSNQIYKMKDDEIEYSGTIIDVLEGTFAREGAKKSINELGRTVTSKLKEDRVLGGYAKGFLVKMDSGITLTVSLKGFDHPAKEKLLSNKSELIGLKIPFVGMAPVKKGGAPRHAHYVKQNK